jgi:hypothetical protein
MKRAIVFAAMGMGLAMAASTGHAQQITSSPYLNNIDVNSAGYSGDWNNVSTTNVQDVTTGSDQGLEFQVNNGMNGSGGENANSFSTFYSYIPTPAIPNTPVTGAVITFTWNSGNAVAGINVVYALDDSSGGTDYYFPTAGYSLTPQPGQTYSYYVPLSDPNLTNLNTGSVVNGFNLQLDPANVYGPYDITFNNIALVPEPASIGMGAISFAVLALRRRRKAAAIA